MDDKSVKLTLERSGTLMRYPGEHARVHAEARGLFESLPPEKRISAMVSRFMAGRQGVRKAAPVHEFVTCPFPIASFGFAAAIARTGPSSAVAIQNTAAS